MQAAKTSIAAHSRQLTDEIRRFPTLIAEQSDEGTEVSLLGWLNLFRAGWGLFLAGWRLFIGG